MIRTSNRAPGRLMKMDDVIYEVSLHRATIYRLIAQDEFPRPHKISRGRVAWTEADIEDWKARALEGEFSDH
jgi:prophage regulatory protein